MITIVLIAMAAFLIAALFLGIGVILKKRTPLKGSCGNFEQYRKDADGHPPGSCESCTCNAPPAAHPSSAPNKA